MAQISNSQRILGFAILTGVAFFFLNGIQTLIATGNIFTFAFTVIASIGGYYVSVVLILKQPFIPVFISNLIGKVKIG